MAAASAAAALPMEILFDEILIKLPAKDILRYKCVSKTFNAAISAAQFTNHHLRHSLATDANRLLIAINQVKDQNDGVHYFDLDSPEIPPTFLPFPATFKAERRHLRRGCYNEDYAIVVGSANGLLLLGRRFGSRAPELLLLNPCTGSYFPIPSQNSVSAIFGFEILGFGYDRVCDDYKIVAIAFKSQVLVYSVKANSWRVVDTTRNPFEGQTFMARVNSAAVVDNRWLHWPIYRTVDQETRHCVIGCFDIYVEDWVDDVPLPDRYWFGTRTLMRNIGILDGCLCVVVQHMDDLSHGYKGWSADVWVMKEYGVKESWIKILDVSDKITKGLMFAPLAYRRGSKCDILVRKGEDTNGTFCWVNTRSKRTYRGNKNRVILPQHGLILNRICQAHVCTGSLVSIPAGITLPKTVQPYNVLDYLYA